ncbi:WD40-repeat-containing domain protein [Dichotomocladium elegans]|nr:WD40-repeat-containing domain protein [Dichotomocladium elegans]
MDYTEILHENAQKKILHQSVNVYYPFPRNPGGILGYVVPELIRTVGRDCLSASDRASITYIWSLFSAAPASQRMLILKGLLSTCCTPQLSFLFGEIRPLLCIDFSCVLPHELSLRIFSFLDARSLCFAAQVSRAWRVLADDDTLWYEMCEQHINKICGKCGWGLPPMGIAQNRHHRHLSSNETTLLAAKGRPQSNLLDQQNRTWKTIYRERLVVERNWRGPNCRSQVLEGHTDGVTCLQFCESSNVLITGSVDRTVRVWDMTTSQEIRQMTGHTRSIKTLQFDSWKLVTGALDNTLRIWDWRSGRCIRKLEGHSNGVLTLHFSARLLASGSMDHTIRIWNFEAGECYTLKGHTGSVNSVRISSANDSKVISASDDRTIRLWDLQTRACIRVLLGHLRPILHALPARTEHGPDIVSASLDNTIKFWNTRNGSCVRTLFGHQEGVLSLALDSLRVVSGSQDRTVRVWDMGTWEWMYALRGHTRPITAVAIGDTKIISATDDGEIRVWDFDFGVSCSS